MSNQTKFDENLTGPSSNLNHDGFDFHFLEIYPGLSKKFLHVQINIEVSVETWLPIINMGIGMRIGPNDHSLKEKKNYAQCKGVVAKVMEFPDKHDSFQHDYSN